jgi:AcrR family transcriptional regulator
VLQRVRFYDTIWTVGKIRDSARTRARILQAATAEFSERGFSAASVSGVARRARVSKQLIHHHFRSKEALFQAVHDLKFRPGLEWVEVLPPDPTDLIAERFARRASDANYIRFLTWEAADRTKRAVPGREGRQRRVAGYGAELKAMQKFGSLPQEVDYRLIQLSIFALATYPLAFGQMTQLVTGRSASDPRFQKAWHAYLKWVGQRLFGEAAGPTTAKPPRKRPTARAARRS